MNNNNRKKILWICIAVLFLFIGAIGTLFCFIGGMEGMSSIALILILGSVFCVFIATASFSLWVFNDSERRGENGLLWALVMLLASPFIGIIIYLLCRKNEKVKCIKCGYSINKNANFCEYCGIKIDKDAESETIALPKPNKGIKFIVAGIISSVLMIGCLGSFFVLALSSQDGFIDKSMFNTGVIYMQASNKWGNDWKTKFSGASMGYYDSASFKLTDSTQKLYADIDCPEGELIMHIIQGEKETSIDVSNLDQILEYDLSDYENGKLTVALEINGAKNVKSHIYVK